MSQSDVVRHDDRMSRFIERLEGENGFLRAQLTKKDEQIEDLSQRFKETQGLLGAVSACWHRCLVNLIRSRLRDRAREVCATLIPDPVLQTKLSLVALQTTCTLKNAVGQSREAGGGLECRKTVIALKCRRASWQPVE